MLIKCVETSIACQLIGGGSRQEEGIGNACYLFTNRLVYETNAKFVEMRAKTLTMLWMDKTNGERYFIQFECISGTFIQKRTAHPIRCYGLKSNFKQKYSICFLFYKIKHNVGIYPMAEGI